MQATQPDPAAPTSYVLAVGAANMDITGSTDNPLTPGDSIPGRVRCAPGGVARNVAENLARLGHAVSLLSVVGDDLNGRSLLDATGGAGVDVSACRVLPGQATSTYLSLHGADGDMALALNDMAILDCITPQLLAALTGVAERVRGAAAVLLDCNLAPDALQWLFARSRGRPVFVDPVSAFKCRRLLPWLDQVHTLKANRLEAQALCGQPVQTDQQVESALRWLLAQGVRQVVLSLGERGVCWGEADGNLGWQRAVPVTVVNATGAGDALMAGLLHGLLRHVPLPQAVQFAVGCAAFTMTAAQANHPGLTVAAVQQLLGAAAPHSTRFGSP